MSWNQGAPQWGQGSGWQSSGQAPGRGVAGNQPFQAYQQRPQGYQPPPYNQHLGAGHGYFPPQGYPASGTPGGYQQPAGSHSNYLPPAAARPPPPGISSDIWHMFQAVDQDASGQITAIELQQALMNGNWTPFNAETCRLMIGMFDRNSNGKIDVHEFGALWKYIQDWRSCFERFDTDRSGRISSQELSQAFVTFGYRLSPAFSQLCILKFARTESGEINFDDFIQCCVMLKALTDAFRRRDSSQQGVIRVTYEEFLEMVLENKLTVV